MNKDKNQMSLETKANMRAQNSILKQHEKVKIIQFLNIADNSLHPDLAVDIDEPIFQPEPKVILFTDYEPLQLRTQVLKLRNRDKVPRRVSIIHPETRLFQVMPYKKSKKKISNEEIVEHIDMTNTKVAPGMEVSYLIKFTPEAKVDVTYDLIVITEREKFIVPIIGIGCKVMLEFMDYLDFGEVPVKYKIEKPIILRNVGEKITKWKLKCGSNNITVSKKEGILEIGKSEQIICTFCPQEDREYEEKLELTYDDFEASIKVIGRSKNDDVFLSRRMIELEQAYITKHSQSFVTIENKTSVPIEFVWKQYPSKEKEDEAKKKVYENLNRQEAEEKILNELQYDYEEVQGDRSFDIDDSYDDEEILKINERHHLKNLNIIARRFEKIKKCLNEDQMLYEHPNFQIEPLQGKIWPNTGMNICITFKPMDAKPHESIAHCDVTGLDQRMSLTMRGSGLGPKAELSYNEKNLLDIPITSTYDISEHEPLIIKNNGVIDCAFTIRPSQTPCGKQFKFGLTEYVLKPQGEDKNNGEKIIPVTFHAERLGEFSEKFIIEITRSQKEIPVVFKGHVIAPSCRFDLGNKMASNGGINFGQVSLHESRPENVQLINDSKVDIKYRLRISSDTDDQNISTIFILSPESGTVKQGQSIPISITFKPEIEKAYDIVILLDMEDIGYDMLTLPISGECKIPEIIINPENELPFEGSYIGKRDCKEIVLFNPHKSLQSQFEVLPQDEGSKTAGEFSVNKQTDTIKPDETTKLIVYLVPKRLGGIGLRMDIKCKTKNNANNKDGNNITSIRITAEAKGPKVVPNTNSIEFKKAEVLKETTEKLELRNPTPIKAKYTVFTGDFPTIFSVQEDKQQGEIPPNEGSLTLIITCKPDTAGYRSDMLYVRIEDSSEEDVKILLTCKAVGHCVRPDYSNLKFDEKLNTHTLEFGTVFTQNINTKFLKFNNLGTKSQTLKFTRRAPSQKEKEKQAEDKRKDDSGDGNCFHLRFNGIEKNMFSIQNGYQMTVPIEAYSNIVNNPDEIFYVQAYPDKSNPSSSDKNLIDNLRFTATFIEPLLDFYPRLLDFDYTYKKNLSIDLISRNLTINNKADLEAFFDIIVKPPFKLSADETEFKIEPQKKIDIQVDFDPTSNKEKKIIENFASVMEINHKNHKFKTTKEMKVKINFPNLNYSRDALDFGSILNDTFKVMTFDVSNEESQMDVIYEWILIEDDNTREDIQVNPTKKLRKETRRIHSTKSSL